MAAPHDEEAEDPREAMRAIIDYFVEQIQTGRTMEQIVAWVHDNMPEYANDIDTVIPFVRRVRSRSKKSRLVRRALRYASFLLLGVCRSKTGLRLRHCWPKSELV